VGLFAQFSPDNLLVSPSSEPSKEYEEVRQTEIMRLITIDNLK